MTVTQIITSSLRMIGQLGPGRSAGTSETTDALFIFNDMLLGFNLERLVIPSVTRSEFSLAASTASYAIGTGATWNTPRPVRLENAGLMLDASTEIPVGVLTDAKFQEIRQKQLPSTQPTSVYYEPSTPNGTVYVYPVPTQVRNLVLYLWAPLGTYSASSDTVVVPDGYGEALRYNLAIRLGIEWNKPIRPEVQQLAKEALSKIKTANTPMMELAVDAELLTGHSSRFDWRTGR